MWIPVLVQKEKMAMRKLLKIEGIPVELYISKDFLPRLVHAKERYQNQHVGFVSFFRDEEVKLITRKLRKLGLKFTLEGYLAFGVIRYIALNIDTEELLLLAVTKQLRKRKKNK